MFSNLIEGIVPASTSNYAKGRTRNGTTYSICKITPHHMAGKLTAKRCGELFQRAGRGASSNYGIGYNGEIYGYVDEADRAWTSSNWKNDIQAITIEVANSETGGDWPISDAAWNSLINLCVDICKRYNFRLNYDGTANGSLTRHNMFASTTCPGPYLQARLPELARVVNEKLDNESKPEPTPAPQPTPSEGYLVKVTANALNIRQGIGTKTPVVGCIRDKGVYTIVETQGNWGKLKSGAGWICLDYTERLGSNTTPKKTNEELANEVIAGKWGNGTDRKNRLTAAGYDYAAIQKIVNQKLK